MTSIYARIMFNGIITKFYIKESIHPKDWDFKKQQARKSKDQIRSNELNSLLHKFRSEIDSVLRDFRISNSGRFPTSSELKPLLKNKFKLEKKSFSEATNSITAYFDKFIDISQKGMRGVFISEATIKTYRMTLEHLRRYENKECRQFSFNDIDLEFYKLFVTYLSQGLSLSRNTIGKYIRTLKTFMRHALECKLHSNLDFQARSFKNLKEETDAIYLNEYELTLLENLDLRHYLTLDQVRDAFLLGCRTGLRYSDYSILKPSNIHFGCIETQQIKTKARVMIPIHSYVQKIIDKYNGGFPPKVSAQHSNLLIKSICKLIPELNSEVEIRQLIQGKPVLTKTAKYNLVSTHSARRSFCTNEYLTGTPILSIMSISGHISEQNFMRYIKIKPQEHAQIFRQFWAKRA